MGGATANAAGFVGSAFSLDGTNNFVQIPDSPALRPTNFTIEAWMFLNSLDSPGNANVGHQYVIFKQNSRTVGPGQEGFDLSKDRYLRSGTNVDLFYFNVCSADGTTLIEVDSLTAVTTGVWYHVAGVRGSNFIQLYVNGQLEAQASVNFPQDYGAQPLYFGTSGLPSWDRKFSGKLDEVSLYNRVLSSNEIAAIYQAGSAGKCKSPTILTQPQSKACYWGGSATFTSAAAGALPLTYQWQRDGAPVAGATNSSLVMTNLQMTNAGSYAVVVTNVVGSTNSGPAILNMKVADVAIALSMVGGTQAVAGLTIGGMANQTYGIQYAASLSQTNGWTGVTNLTLTAPTNVWEDPQLATQPQRYYRVGQGPIPIP